MLFFLITGWIGYFHLAIKDYDDNDKSNNQVWSFINVNEKNQNDDEIGYAPIQGKNGMYIAIFTILMIIGTIAFALYLFKSTCQKDEQVFEGMMGNISRYHFVPLICASILFIVGLTIDANDINKEDTVEKYLTKFAFNLTFSILGLLTMAFIKYQTKIEQPFYIVYSINEGIYSCLIALFTYSLFYSSIYTGMFSKMKTALDLMREDFSKAKEIIEDIPTFLKNCGIAFSIMIGLINVGVGIFLQDVMIPLMNFIIYLGLTIYFFSVNKDAKKKLKVDETEGAFDIIYLVLSFIVVALTGIRKFKARSLKS